MKYTMKYKHQRLFILEHRFFCWIYSTMNWKFKHTQNNLRVITMIVIIKGLINVTGSSNI